MFVGWAEKKKKMRNPRTYITFLEGKQPDQEGVNTALSLNKC